MGIMCRVWNVMNSAMKKNTLNLNKILCVKFYQIGPHRWKWRNVLTSFIHSFVTGVWAPLAFYLDPSIRTDMIHSFNNSIHILVSFSVGYFIYDFFDMFIYHKKRSTYELLLHHFMVILCYSIAVSSMTYVSYAALSLVVEINSIFLHGRQVKGHSQILSAILIPPPHTHWSIFFKIAQYRTF